MSTIVLRSVKGSPLTNAEVDANFTNLNNDKTQLGGTYSSGTANGVLYLSSSKVLTTGSALTFDGSVLATTGNLRVDGIVTLGNASGDTVLISGKLGFGSIPATNTGIYYRSTASEITGSTSGYGIYVDAPFASDVTSVADAARFRVNTAAAAYTTANASGVRIPDAVKGAGSTITNQHGLYISDQTQGTNNYGITSLVSSGTDKWNIYASGTAANYFAGNVAIGATSTPLGKLGVTVSSASALDLYRTGTAGEVRLNFYNDNASSAATVAGRIGGLLTTTTAGAENGALLFSTIGAGTTSERMRLDSAGNLGLGVTPSAWGGTNKAIEVFNGLGLSSTASTVAAYSQNAYNDGTNWIYRFTNPAALYLQSSGTHIWRIAPSGTAGNAITFTQAMTLDASGRLGIGTTSPDVRLFVSDSANDLQMRVGSLTAGIDPIVRLQGKNVADTTNRYADIKLNADAGLLTLMAPHTTGPTIDALNIDSSGDVGIGTTSPLGVLDVAGTAPTLNIRDTQSKVSWAAGETVGTLDFYSNDTSGVGAQAVSRIRSVADIASAAPTGALAFWTAAAGSAATEKLRITSAGNVGIGTNSPSSVLQVSGEAKFGLLASPIRINSTSTTGIIEFSSSFSGVVRTLGAVPLIFETDSTAHMRLDAAGNLGLGVVPSAWGSSFAALDINTVGGVAASGTSTQFSRNSYFDGTDWFYKTTSTAERYQQGTGGHTWFTAASGTAGAAITFTQAMTLDASGDLGIGTSSPTQRLDVSMLNSGASGTVAVFRNAGTSTVNTAARIVLTSRSGDEIRGSYIEAINVGGANYPFDLVFGTSSSNATPTERMRIDNSGNVQTSTGAQVVWAPAPASISTTATLTNANIQGQIINTTGTSYTVTMPLGTTLETLVPWASTNLGYDFTVINTASGTITMAVNTGVTSLGGLTIATGVSAGFRIRRTATNTFVLYRLR